LTLEERPALPRLGELRQPAARLLQVPGDATREKTPT